MPELDGAKEEISYLKLWLGIMIATDISLIAWLINNFRAAQRLFLAGAVMVILAIASGCIALHRRISSKIDELRRL
jgi:hypothetical protein